MVLVQGRLPEDWLASPGGSSLQPTLTLRGPNGSQVTLGVEVRASLEPRDVAAIMVRPVPPQLVMAPYLGPRTRELLEQSGVGFVDLTGNLRLVVSEPCIFLSAAGAARGRRGRRWGRGWGGRGRDDHLRCRLHAADPADAHAEAGGELGRVAIEHRHSRLGVGEGRHYDGGLDDATVRRADADGNVGHVHA